MSYWVMPLKRSDFDTLSNEERILFLQCWHILHQVEVLEKALLVSMAQMRKPVGNEHELTAHVCQLVFFAKHLAGVLHEAWESIKKGYHNSKLSRSIHPQLRADTQDALKKLGSYFSQGSNLVSTLRNEFSFHSDMKQIERGLDLINQNEDFAVIVPDGEGMFFCGLAEDMITAAMLDAIDSSDHKAAVERLFRELVKDVTDWITTFCHDFCSNICARFDPESEEIEIVSEVAVDDLVFPYFVRKTRE